jgi:hypothetical protein
MFSTEDISNLTLKIYAAASSVVDEMQDHDRTTVPELCARVEEKLNFNPIKLRAVVEFFIQHHSELVIVAGRFGGIFKNGRASNSKKIIFTPIDPNQKLLEEIEEIFK